jgi:hypothetical protein
MPYEHIRISRDEPVRERHKNGRYFPPAPPQDVAGFGSRLKSRLQTTVETATAQDVGGFDDRLLVRVTLRDGAAAPPLDDIEGVTVISQEEKTVLLAFATREGIATFESRLSSLAETGTATKKELLFAIEDFNRWEPANRAGAALAAQGFPEEDAFVLDVELWPLESPQQRSQLLDAFREWAIAKEMAVLDTLLQPSLILARLRVSALQANMLLNHRDVRTVDLPPKATLGWDVVLADVNQFPPTPAPAENAAKIAVLDSGLAQQHPFLAPAIGDVQGFIPPDRSAADESEHGHGTFVAGIALYGDVAASVRNGAFVPQLWLFSGRVFSDDGRDQTQFVEKSVEEAVRYFHTNYQCRVFNLSYGDLNKVYDGKHVRGLAYTLDRLTRELDVLFVVSTGNLTRSQLPPNPLADYPGYLLEAHARLLDPAPALNAITVGGIALLDQSQDAVRNSQSIEDVPIARVGHPSPFTRSGLSVGQAIKPDFVEDAGNLAFVPSRNSVRHQGLGVVSTSVGFAAGRPLKQDHGTSFAAPRVAHLAARLAHRFPDQSVNLIRAILACHAHWPAPSVQLLNADGKAPGRESLIRLLGYGRVAEGALLESLENEVTLFAEDRIGNDRTQFYELPLPAEYWGGGQRSREISIALAYAPEVRTTRLEYRHTRMSFTLVESDTLQAVADAFTKGRAKGIPELKTGRNISGDGRKTATLQSSRWAFKQSGSRKLFVVVTRNDANWSVRREQDESYALAVLVRDRDNTTVNLHARMNAQLQVRVQERARARV